MLAEEVLNIPPFEMLPDPAPSSVPDGNAGPDGRGCGRPDIDDLVRTAYRKIARDKQTRKAMDLSLPQKGTRAKRKPTV